MKKFQNADWLRGRQLIPNSADNLKSPFARPGHVAQKRMTKQLVPVHLDLPLFWKCRCATCFPACVILCHVT